MRPDFAFLKCGRVVLKAGDEAEVWCNSHGAVAAIMGDGPDQCLGLKPDEFEVIEWHDAETVLRETRAWAAQREAALVRALKRGHEAIETVRSTIDRTKLAAWDAAFKAVPQ